MENVTKLLRVSFYILIFFTGITLLYLISRRVESVTDLSLEVMNSDNILYEAPLENQSYLANQAEIIAQIMDDIPYEISIIDQTSTYLIHTEAYYAEDMADIVITSDQYEKSYQYNEEGMIQTILYRYVQ